jgi:hypothetical protein
MTAASVYPLAPFKCAMRNTIARVKQSKEDLLDHLRDQLQFLDASCKSFDAGFEGEAKRVATVLRVLIFDSNKQHSLLGQLGVKLALQYHDAAGAPPSPNTIVFVGLSMGRGEGGMRYFPKLSEPKRKLTFDDWWSAPIVIQKVTGVQVSRKDSILSLANQDGGSHVDPALDHAYFELSRRNAIGWKSNVGPPGKPFENSPTPAIVRQIGHEVLGTLREQLPTLLPEFRERA